ncbi:MAG: hypothetical protein LBS92_04035 [Candidatus Methanoplasma sp.]|jgi:hypothetical protein|nr:hypothetical protein [Candidatus Methanoplasma sp.]
MSKPGSEKLISAVAKAWGKEIRVRSFNDRLVMQKGCFLLNDMGVLPRYKFRLYIRGPYSSELADDYYELLKGNMIPSDTDVGSGYIEELSGIMSKGIPYLEAYSTLILARGYNPEMNASELKDFVLKIKPALKKEVEEAATSPIFR